MVWNWKVFSFNMFFLLYVLKGFKPKHKTTKSVNNIQCIYRYSAENKIKYKIQFNCIYEWTGLESVYYLSI